MSAPRSRQTGLRSARSRSELPPRRRATWSGSTESTIGTPGASSRAAARWGFLERSLFAQGFGENLELPFTGDETFRAAMNAAFGLGLEHPHQDTSYSLNSQLLWLRAAEDFERLALATGETARLEEVRSMRAQMESTIRDRYALENGCLAAGIDVESGETYPPFEDAFLKLGWLDSGFDDRMIFDALECAIDLFDREGGVIVSPLDPQYVGFPLLPAEEGIYTGMLPGYTLAALADAGHRDAEAAFAHFGERTLSSGNYHEYQVLDDDSPMVVTYAAAGEGEDITAGYRPWEGGINYAAIVDYLLGLRPDVSEDAIVLRPHFPGNWPSMTFDGVRVADDRIHVEFTRANGVIELVLGLEGDGAYDAVLEWDSSVGELTFEVGGEVVQASAVSVGDITRFTLPLGLLDSGAAVRIAVSGEQS